MVLDNIPNTKIFKQRDVRETPISTSSATALSVTDATYLTLSNNADLTDERVLTAGEGINFNDGGANTTLTISGENATDTNKGIASFDLEDFSVTSGAVALKAIVVTSIDGDTGTATPAIHNFDILGGTGITTVGSSNDITINLDPHTIASHSDTTATGAELETLTGGGDTTLHDHDGITENTAARHSESHTIASHSDTTGTGAELNTLTDDSMVDTLHRHSELSASDGTPDRALVVDAVGRVGIGTSSPDNLLHVQGGNITIDSLDADNNEEKGSLLFGGNSGGGIYTAGITFERGADFEDGNLLFKTATGGEGTLQENMRLTHDGKVGIGTSSPQEKLHVQVAGDARIGIQAADGSDAVLEIGQDINAGKTWGLGLDDSNSDAFIIAYSASGNPSLTDSGLFTIETGGNVGIGTDSPGLTLDIHGSDAGIIIYNTDSNSGTEASSIFFDAKDTSGTERNIATIKAISLSHATGRGELAFFTRGSTGTSEQMRIDENGNVGIGTETPNETLTVEAGVLSIKETTEPTATTNYGKIYTKTDNKLYFQDGAGTETAIAAGDVTSIIGGTGIDASSATGDVTVSLTKPSMFELIETKTFTDATPATFSSLGSYDYLVLIVDSEKGGIAGSDNQLRMRFNADSGSNYRYHFMNDTSPGLNASTASMLLGVEDWRQVTVNIMINSRHGKHGLGISGGTQGGGVEPVSGVWTNGSAITSISFLNDGGDSGDGETGQMSLYGINN